MAGTCVRNEGWSHTIGCPVNELTIGYRPVGRPALRFKDVCRCDLKLTDMAVYIWELFATTDGGMRESRKQDTKTIQASNPHSNFVCNTCGKNCHARIGLLSRSRIGLQSLPRRCFPQDQGHLSLTGSILTSRTQGATAIMR